MCITSVHSSLLKDKIADENFKIDQIAQLQQKVKLIKYIFMQVYMYMYMCIYVHVHVYMYLFHTVLCLYYRHLMRLRVHGKHWQKPKTS